ncbi:MAG: hypothetical protein R3C60_05045 [Parvularculaceae bacterium]
MTFGKRGVRRNAHGEKNGGAGAPFSGRASAGGPPDYALNYSFNDSALGIAGAFFFGWLLQPYFYGVEMDVNAIFLCMFFGIGFLGSLVIVFMGLSGKTKLRVDATGLARDQFFGESRISWDDLEGFEIMSVNYNKIVFAKAKKDGGLTSSKKLTMPKEAFKSKNTELLNWALYRRPDLAHLFLGVMSEVGAKKLARQFIEESAAL